MPFLGTMKYFTRSKMSLGIYCYSYIYNVKVEQYCWNQPYYCLPMCSQWSVLNIRCCSHSFSPSISYPTVREKCLLCVSDAQPVHGISCQPLTCWFLEVTCSFTLVQLLFEGDPGHMCRRSSSAQRKRKSSVTLLHHLTFEVARYFFFFWHQQNAK